MSQDRAFVWKSHLRLLKWDCILGGEGVSGSLLDEATRVSQVDGDSYGIHLCLHYRRRELNKGMMDFASNFV